jgi:hypothetical protein
VPKVYLVTVRSRANVYVGLRQGAQISDTIVTPLRNERQRISSENHAALVMV